MAMRKSGQVEQTTLFVDDARPLRSGSVEIGRISLPAGYEPDARAVEGLAAMLARDTPRHVFDVTSAGTLVRDFELFVAHSLTGASIVKVRVRTEKELAEGVEGCLAQLAGRLNYLERCEELLRGQEFYEALFPNCRKGGYDRSAVVTAVGSGGGGQKRGKCVYGESAFTEWAATQVNLRQRTLQEDVRIAKRLDARVRDRIRGLRVSRKKSDLSVLGDLMPAEQLAVVDKMEEENLGLEDAMIGLGFSKPPTREEETARALRRLLRIAAGISGWSAYAASDGVSAVLEEFRGERGGVVTALTDLVDYFSTRAGIEEVRVAPEEKFAA